MSARELNECKQELHRWLKIATEQSARAESAERQLAVARISAPEASAMLIAAQDRVADLLHALELIRQMAAHNSELHTGFVHIGRMAASRLDRESVA